jgi:microcystin-dependent protein
MARVLVGKGDQVQIRYPTPSTWNTRTTVQVKIGTGLDPTDVTFGTRIPDAKPDQFNFTNQSGALTPGGTPLTSFEKNTFYYSNSILISGIEIFVPVSISVTTSGPRNLSSNTSQAAFEVNNSGTWVTTAQVKNGDVIRLRIRTENWYTTTTNVTLSVSDETWGGNLGLNPNTTVDTWSITTRPQVQNIPQFSFIDYIDVTAGEFGSYKTITIPVSNIDNDAVLRATSTGNVQISSNNINWSQSLTGLVLGDTIYTRIAIGSYTTKTTGIVRVFAVSNETYTRGSNSYDNNTPGTYGRPDLGVSERYTITQTLGDVTDNWQVWTEVDRYPDSISLSPIYAISDGEKVYVSSKNSYSRAEVTEFDQEFWYYADFNITGLGVEYPTGTYFDLEEPFSFTSTGRPSLPIDTSSVNGRNVEIRCRIAQGNGSIRKNDTGEWVQSLFVKNGDKVTVRQLSSELYNQQLTTKIILDGPPDGGPIPYANPTNGPSAANRSFANLEDTITIKTRLARDTPYPFKGTNIYRADPGESLLIGIPLGGYDIPVDATIVSQSANAAAQISYDGLNYSSSTLSDIPVTSTLLSLRFSSSTSYGGVSFVTYSIGNYTDTIYAYTVKRNWNYSTYIGNDSRTSPIEYNLPDYAENFDFVLVGAGGGNGGDDAPNSYGGRGGFGNLLRGKITLPPEFFIGNDYRIKLYPAGRGINGVNFSTNAPGGAGGWGYATGGSGGDSGLGDSSGSGGGGGGASAIAFFNGTLIALAGGGAGGGGAGNDTEIQKENQNGNYNGFGSLQNTLNGLNLSGIDGQNNSAQGGGAGGSGGGFGSAGIVPSNKLDEFNVIIQTNDLDATGGTGGGAYYDSNIVALETTNNFSNFGSGAETQGTIIIGIPPQDRTPNPFAFTSVLLASTNTTYESEKVQITGITGRVLVSTFENQSKIRVCDSNQQNCSAYTSTPQFVRNNEWIQVQMTTGLDYYTQYPIRVVVGDTEVYWIVETGEPPDTIPNPFEIPDKLFPGVEPDTLIESDEVEISGINTLVNITASGGAEISICSSPGVCDAFLPSPRQIGNNQLFKVRLRSSTQYLTTVGTTVRVGDSNPESFDIRTIKEPDRDPNSFIFFEINKQPLQTVVKSKNSVVIQGIDSPILFRVTRDDGLSPNATIILNGVNTNQSSVQVELFDVVRLQYLTSNIPGQRVEFTIEAGDFETSWAVTNDGSFGTNPAPFVFTPVYANSLQYGVSNETITISGLGVPSVSLYGTNGAQFSINGGSFTEYTVSSPGSISNGQTFRVRMLASAIGGFDVVSSVTAGSYSTSFTVYANANVQDPILGQWYSSIQTIKPRSSGEQVRFSTKFEGLPIGTIMPVFQDGTENDNWGNLDGKADSRFHGWIWCNGDFISNENFPLLFEIIGKSYGATSADTTLFRLPDFRNRKVLGTGPIDGNSASSPIVNPLYGPGKIGLNASGNIPGSQGGMWFVDTIADPGIDTTGNNNELEQVETPATGQPAQSSEYFAIASIRTTGYEQITGSIEFSTAGSINGSVSLSNTRIFEVPRHIHEMVSGQPDPIRNKGYVQWGGRGGFQGQLQVTNVAGQVGPLYPTDTFRFNVWGYCTDDYQIDAGSDDVPPLSISAEQGSNLPRFLKNVEEWGSGSGYIGLREADSDPYWNFIEVKQPNIRSGSPNFTEVNSYINLNTWSGGSASKSGGLYRFIGALDIPERSVTVQSFTPERKSHSHYISLSNPGDQNNTFSWGKDNGPGAITPGSQFATNVISVSFDALEVGMEVLPGTFTLASTKQLVPVPEFAPQTEVPLISPYIWVKWLIKAF